MAWPNYGFGKEAKELSIFDDMRFVFICYLNLFFFLYIFLTYHCDLLSVLSSQQFAPP
jgi:hypothetical protein